MDTYIGSFVFVCLRYVKIFQIAAITPSDAYCISKVRLFALKIVKKKILLHPFWWRHKNSIKTITLYESETRINIVIKFVFVQKQIACILFFILLEFSLYNNWNLHGRIRGSNNPSVNLHFKAFPSHYPSHHWYCKWKFSENTTLQQHSKNERRKTKLTNTKFWYKHDTLLLLRKYKGNFI